MKNNYKTTSSILLSVKKLLGLSEEVTCFDSDIIMHINSALFILTQIGVGPETGFTIQGTSETYKDFLGEEVEKYEPVKTYLYYRVKLGFDPPTSSAVMECVKSMINEFEWRLNSKAEYEEEV